MRIYVITQFVPTQYIIAKYYTCNIAANYVDPSEIYLYKHLPANIHYKIGLLNRD